MNRKERVKEMMAKKEFAGWSKKDCMDELSDWSDEDVSNGYAIFDYNATGMLEIEAIGVFGAFDYNDEKATEQAIKDGVKIIPVNELPDNFERKYLGWIDTPENRKAIEKYCGVN